MYRELSRMPLLVCFLYIICVAATCEDDIQLGPRPSEFTKSMREDLGNLISSTIVVNSTQFPIVPNQAPFDSAYWYLQTLYDQATEFTKLDRGSMQSDRWSQNREWQVYIINDDNTRNAFTVPGGDFFITTGMLKSLDKEYEIYYLMVFESQLMNNRDLLNRLITEYSSIALDHLINRTAQPNNATANIIASELPDLVYNEEVVAEIDAFTVDAICNTSIFDRLGVIELLEEDDDRAWFEAKNYNSRKTIVPHLGEIEATECGLIKSNGTYQRFVLNKLE